MKNKIISALSSISSKLSNGLEDTKLSVAIRKSYEDNPWFDANSIDLALKSIGKWLRKENLEAFTKNYSFANSPKRVAVICAGNIPAVGFHDMLCVLLSGHKLLCKLSSQDKYLLPAIAELLIEEEPTLIDYIEFAEDRIKNFDAVIATGSNNTRRYFDYYFGSYPNIIRHSRTSIGVIVDENKHNTVPVNYSLLMDDILTYKGLGCRNVSKIYVPENFDFTPLIEASKEYESFLDHNKYRNNYDYYKTIYIMNNVKFIDSGVLSILENKSLFNNVSILHFEYYKDIEDVIRAIEIEKDNIQCVVSNSRLISNSIEIGQAQNPKLNEFADNIDTMKFLNSI
ncbi:MAG: acyl-CoA reductase [Bacteroidales bacterium]|nr:acyl-CoA reductase [Bacteroidales bacterium]MDD4684219.1 acyl-CoA reductase [Bacteroidales bacterium]